MSPFSPFSGNLSDNIKLVSAYLVSVTFSEVFFRILFFSSKVEIENKNEKWRWNDVSASFSPLEITLSNLLRTI